MPSRAFLLFGQLVAALGALAPADGFNALAGIFAFRTWLVNHPNSMAFDDVSMPSRAFLLFGRIARDWRKW